MRSDFYSLPYAAQMAIRRGEESAHRAARVAGEVGRLRAKIEKLRLALQAAQIHIELNDRRPQSEATLAVLGKAESALKETL